LGTSERDKISVARLFNYLNKRLTAALTVPQRVAEPSRAPLTLVQLFAQASGDGIMRRFGK